MNVLLHNANSHVLLIIHPKKAVLPKHQAYIEMWTGSFTVSLVIPSHSSTCHLFLKLLTQWLLHWRTFPTASKPTLFYPIYTFVCPFFNPPIYTAFVSRKRSGRTWHNTLLHSASYLFSWAFVLALASFLVTVIALPLSPSIFSSFCCTFLYQFCNCSFHFLNCRWTTIRFFSIHWGDIKQLYSWIILASLSVQYVNYVCTSSFKGGRYFLTNVLNFLFALKVFLHVHKGKTWFLVMQHL